MSKFKVWDRVRVVDYLVKRLNGEKGIILYDDGVIHVVKMDNKEVFKEYSANRDDIMYFDEEELELVKEEKKFKVGDRVNVNTKYFEGEAVVVSLDSSVGWDYVVRFHNDRFSYGFNEHELSLVEEGPTLVLGDRVVLRLKGVGEGEEDCWLRPYDGWQGVVTAMDPDVIWVAFFGWEGTGLERFRGVIGLTESDVVKA